MRILVVEDEADLNLLLRKVLTKAGYTVDGCRDGEEAQLHLLGAEYDAILLDVMMPKKDGYTLVRELREAGNGHPGALPHRPGQRVRPGEGPGPGGGRLPGQALRLRRAAGPHPGHDPQARGAADQPLHRRGSGPGRGPAAGHPGRGGDPLLPKEFSILEYLLRNKEKVLSREQIENRIWNYEYSGSSNNVDGYMSRLRKKIDEGRDQKLIHTVKGVGWVIREPEDRGERP